MAELCSRLIALPWQEAEKLLEASGCAYETEMTRPTRDFFKVDEDRLFVVRALRHDDKIKVTLAAKVIPAV